MMGLFRGINGMGRIDGVRGVVGEERRKRRDYRHHVVD